MIPFLTLAFLWKMPWACGELHAMPGQSNASYSGDAPAIHEAAAAAASSPLPILPQPEVAVLNLMLRFLYCL